MERKDEAMDSNADIRTGGHILIDQLALHGADTVFGVPGESFLAALDGMYQNQRVRFVNSRHEGGAAMMADAYGKLTGRPGIAFATRGPGATNASAGVHVAFQDSTPLILLLGQVGRDMMEREAFQEIDYRQMFGPMTKWVAQIDDARRIPEFISRAFYTATSGRPGPVVLALPEDMLTDQVDVADAQPYKPQTVAPGAESLKQFQDLLTAARRPLLIVGGGGWSDGARRDLEAFATAHEVPIGASFRCQDYCDNLHPAYAGHVGIGISQTFADRIRGSDLVIALGARLGEITTSGYSLFDIPQPKQPLVHIYPDPEEIGRVYAPTLGIVSGSAAFAAAVSRLEPRHQPRGDALKAAHSGYLAYAEPTISPGDVQLARIVHDLGERLPDDAIICNGAGNYAVWVHRFWRYRQYRTELAPTSGSMGYGLPAAVAAKLLHPNRTVIAFAGDGCFQMTGMEFMTAVENRLPIIVIVCNNGMYGTIRMHQERTYPGRVSGTDLANPDFAALARACGGFGARVDRTEEFAQAFDDAVASGLPSIIELAISPEALTPVSSLSETRAKALAARG
jgi:acetolactate synthase-1/2/3 large subunit